MESAGVWTEKDDKIIKNNKQMKIIKKLIWRLDERVLKFVSQKHMLHIKILWHFLLTYLND